MAPASVLIVAYNAAAHLVGCLAALEKQTLPRHRFEVIVVDNASADDTMGLRPRFPWVRFHRLPRNVGFARGNNAAAELAHGRTLVLLNPDTEPDPFWLEELLRAVAANPGRVVASKLVLAADPTRVNSGGLYLTRDGRGADAGFTEIDDGRYEGGGPVFAGCGAALAVEADTAGRVLDPSYFLYYEDLDFGWRRRLAGHGAVLAPRSLVRHAVGAAAGDSTPLFRFHVEKNRAVTSLRNADPFLAVWSGLTLAAKVGQAAVRVIRGRLPAAHLRAVSLAFLAYFLRIPRTLLERDAVRGSGEGGRCGW